MELEPLLKEKFEKIDVKPRKGLHSTGNPEYSFDESSRRYPQELVYDLDGIKLTISERNSGLDNEVRIKAESPNEEGMKDLIEDIDDLYEEYGPNEESGEEVLSLQGRRKAERKIKNGLQEYLNTPGTTLVA